MPDNGNTTTTSAAAPVVSVPYFTCSPCFPSCFLSASSSFWLSSSRFDTADKQTKTHVEEIVHVTTTETAPAPASHPLLSCSSMSVSYLSPLSLSALCPLTGACAAIAAPRQHADTKGHIFSADLAPDLSSIISGSSDGRLCLLSSSLSDPRFLSLGGLVGDVTLTRFMPASILFVTSASADFAIRLSSADGPIRAFTGSRRCVSDIAFVDRGRLFFTADREGITRIYDCANTLPINTFTSAQTSEALACRVWGSCCVTTTSSGRLFAFDPRAPSGGPVAQVDVGEKALNALCAWPSNPDCFTVGDDDGVIHNVDLRTGLVVSRFQRDAAAVTRIEAADEGKVAIANSTGAVSLIDPASSADNVSIVREFVCTDGSPITALACRSGQLMAAQFQEIALFNIK